MAKKSTKKNVLIGMGSSTDDDPSVAANEAVQQALKDCPRPDFSLVYTNAAYDQQKFLKTINEQLGTNWVGVSSDKMFTSKNGYSPDTTIAVLCLQSEYMHFSVGVADNYRKDPRKAARMVAERAIANMESDKYVDAYIQFKRTKSSDYGNIIRTPPHFMLTFMSGVKMKDGKVTPGQEVEFISGLLEFTGPHIPLFGGSASSALEDYFEDKANNYQFANGKLYHDAAIVVFVVCNLHFATIVQHGYDTTDDFAVVTKLDKSGYDILELNGKEPVTEYARMLGVSKQKYLKDVDRYSFWRPFGLVLPDGTTYVKEVYPNPDKKTLHSNFKIHKHSILNVLKFDEKKTVGTLKNAVHMMSEQKKGKTPAFTLFCSCSGRRPLTKDIEKKDISAFRKVYKDLPFFGFYSFSEVGSTRTTSAQSHSQTVTSLMIFNDLLTT